MDEGRINFTIPLIYDILLSKGVKIMEDVERITKKNVSPHPTGIGQLTIFGGDLKPLGLKAHDEVKVITKKDEIIIRRVNDG
jgi:formylmethanofuran dehydrogenase subunit D